MSQSNYSAIIRQLQEQVTALEVRSEVVTVSIEVVRLQVFDRILSKVSGFMIVCKLYIRMKIKGTSFKEQIQQVLLYVQEGSVDIWKKNMLEDLKVELLEYKTVGEFLTDIRREFRRGDKESVKVMELRKLEQGGKTAKKFI